MPLTSIIFYKEADGSCPLVEWLDHLPEKARDKCIVRIERLHELGHELRRPEADLLRDGIYELRIGFQGINHRILYFFHNNFAAVLSHGIIKERVVPPREINLAIRRKQLYMQNPERHTYRE